MKAAEYLKISSKFMTKKSHWISNMEVTDVCGEKCFSKFGGSRRQSGEGEG